MDQRPSDNRSPDAIAGFGEADQQEGRVPDAEALEVVARDTSMDTMRQVALNAAVRYHADHPEAAEPVESTAERFFGFLSE